MSFGTGADSALRCICWWYGSLPLLADELLFQALPAKTADYPELPVAILAELFLRRWLYPQPFESNEEWQKRLAPHLHHSQFAAQFAHWAAAQVNERTYEMPNAILDTVDSELENALIQTLKDGLNKWADAHGVIAFLGSGITPEEDRWRTTPPMADLLLPFRLVDRNLHQPVADFGRRAAVLANNMSSQWVNLDDVFLYFPTLSARLPEWLGGESGALAIWFALRANECALPRKALDIGLAGCLGRWSATATLDYGANDRQVVRRKWEIFKRARVPIIVLPDTMGYGGPDRDECMLWPHSQPVKSCMDDLLSRQMALHPDTKELKRIESCLIEGEEDIHLEIAHRTLVEMEFKRHPGKETARRINFFAYICCCRMGRDAEAMQRERRILELPAAETRDFPIQLRSAYAIGDGTAPRLLALAVILKKIFLGNLSGPSLNHNQNDKENENERPC